MTRAGSEVVAASDADTRRLEELQYVLGEGPTGDAFASARPVLAADVGAELGRWVQFAAAATERGVGGAYAWPLQLGAIRPGVLTLYCWRGQRLDETGLHAALELAETARDLLPAGSTAAARRDGGGGRR